MAYVRYPLSLRQVEDPLFERGIDICHETVGFWWNRSGPVFAAEIGARRVDHQAYSNWRWYHPHFSVSVNIPPIVLGRGRTVIEDLGLIHRIHQITGEITERQALDNLGRSAIRLARDLEAHIAIDDFETGNSGLQQLIGPEVDALKIDRSFIGRLGEDGAAERLVRAIVALATVLDVGLVAEGVETAEQALFLRAVGVDKGQGWYSSKAVGPAGLTSAIAKGKRPD